MKKVSVLWLVLIQWALAIEWLHSGWGKWTGPGFMDNIGKTLEGFAAKTPYTSYASILRSTAIPNAEMFGNLIRSGEILVGVGFVIAGIWLVRNKTMPMWLGGLITIACFGAALMNLNFFLASGWSSPSTWGVNMVMFLIEVILGVFYIKNRNELTK